ncbi:MAG: hypothetical protein ACXVDB_08675 [Tumebacillaceae bacterium]
MLTWSEELLHAHHKGVGHLGVQEVAEIEQIHLAFSIAKHILRP